MKVLLGIGGTDDSVEALHKTIERVSNTGDELTIAIVDNPAATVTREEVERVVRGALDAADVRAEIRRVDGDPGARLVEIAERESFDQICLGGGERSPMGKIRIGSVQEFVLLNSHKTVSLVR